MRSSAAWASADVGVVVPDRRGREGVLHRRRREAARRDRRLRPDRESGMFEIELPAQADPRHPQAGHRRGQRLRGRRRPRAARAVRPDDRRRDRAVRPGRPAGRLLRRRLRLRLPGPRRRREAGPRDLVPVPPVRRRDSRALGPGQRGRAGRPSCSTRSRRWADEIARDDARPRCASSSSRSTPTPTTSPASASSRSAAWTCSSESREAAEGVTAFAEKRPPDFAPHRARASA